MHVLSHCMDIYDTISSHYYRFVHIDSLSWLKRHLRFLGLHRKDSRVLWNSTTLVHQCVEASHIIYNSYIMQAFHYLSA